MGIKQLSALLKKVVPATMGQWRCANEYRDQTVAIDASPCLYQCMTAMGDTPPGVVAGSPEDTSHIQGVLRRTLRLLELGFQPIFVFDGEAPELKKASVLKKRAELRARSREQLVEAEAAGDQAKAKQHAARLVKVTPQHNEEVMELLRLLGVQAVQAQGEAECLCAAMAASGRAHAAATEDMDALAFGAPRLLRNLHRASAQPQVPLVQEISLTDVLDGLTLSRAEFVDLCILAGCDYLGTIRGIGIMNAYKLVKQHRSINVILDKLDPRKHIVPESWDFEAARECFLSSELCDDLDKISSTLASYTSLVPDVSSLRSLLCGRYALASDMVEACIRRLVVVKGAFVQPCPTPNGALAPAIEGRSDDNVTHHRTHQLVAEALEAEPSHESNALERPVATPNRSTRAPRAVPKPLPIPTGQQTLRKFFGGKRHQTNEQPPSSPRKRRRQGAVGVLTGHFGADFQVPESAALEAIELLVGELEGNKGSRDTASASSAERPRCQSMGIRSQTCGEILHIDD